MNSSEQDFDKIEYDSDWQTLSDTSYAQPYDEQEQQEQKSKENENAIGRKKEKSSKQLVTIFQLIICVLIFAVFYILKQTDTDFYRRASQWYSENLNNSLISTSVFSDFDINSLGSVFATDDEN